MISSVAMMKNYSFVSSLKFWALFINLLLQFMSYEFMSVAFFVTDFSQFYKFIIHHALPVTPNTQHYLGVMNIRLCHWFGSLFHMWSFAFKVVHNGSIFHHQLQYDAKRLQFPCFWLYPAALKPFEIWLFSDSQRFYERFLCLTTVFIN